MKVYKTTFKTNCLGWKMNFIEIKADLQAPLLRCVPLDWAQWFFLQLLVWGWVAPDPG